MSVVVIVGATGSGKSDLAIRLAREFHGEIICADSRTVYRGMDVGTAKTTDVIPPLPAKGGGGARGGEVTAEVIRTTSPPPTPPLPADAERGRVRHHLLDIRDPDQPYSVAEFKEDAERCIREIAGRGKLSIVVGGTMLYVRALVDNLNLAGAKPNPERRAELEQMSLAALQQLLEKLDPDSTDHVDVENPRRLIRAIETIEATGMSLAASRAKRDPPFDYCIIGLDMPREELHRRIATRTHAMFARGLVEETQRLLEQYGPDIESLRGVVYREVVAWIQSSYAASQSYKNARSYNSVGRRSGNGAVGGVEGNISPSNDEVVACINAALRRYARRQLAWWRKDPRVQWVRTYAEAREVVVLS